MIIISIGKQRLYHRRETGVWFSYPVSTASRGAGNQRDSLQTPLGRHQICARIGEDMPEWTAFAGREPIAIFDSEYDDPQRDWILSRILWLDGIELGKNKRGAVDSKSRYIYIHGTHEEDRLGSPASHGCIRMANDDVIELFDLTHIGERVIIRP